MEGNYPVLLGQKPVGKVQVQKCGLYYRIICRCRLTGDVITRLYVQCGDKHIPVGVVVPEGSGFGLDIKIPVKRIGEGELKFSLASKQEKTAGKFVPITPEEPFGYLDRLKDCVLTYENGQAGIYITEKTGTE